VKKFCKRANYGGNKPFVYFLCNAFCFNRIFNLTNEKFFLRQCVCLHDVLRLADNERCNQANRGECRHGDIGDLPVNKIGNIERPCACGQCGQSVSQHVGGGHRGLVFFIQRLYTVGVNYNILGGRREGDNQGKKSKQRQVLPGVCKGQ